MTACSNISLNSKSTKVLSSDWLYRLYKSEFDIFEDNEDDPEFDKLNLGEGGRELRLLIEFWIEFGVDTGVDMGVDRGVDMGVDMGVGGTVKDPVETDLPKLLNLGDGGKELRFLRD